MDVSRLQPDSQSHYLLYINNNEVQVSFRYFSPQKFRRSNTYNMSVSPQVSEKQSVIADEAVTQRIQINDFQKNKVVLNPKKTSKLFYQQRKSQINNEFQQNYENFQKKLIQKNQNIVKRTKINLTNNKTKPNDKSYKNSNVKFGSHYIRKAQIDLNKQNYQPKKKQQRSTFNKSRNSVSTFLNMNQNRQSNLSVFLYENQGKRNKKLSLSLEKSKKDENNIFQTPRKRSVSSRKGISVLSSESSRKKQNYFSLSPTKKKQQNGYAKKMVIKLHTQKKQGHNPQKIRQLSGKKTARRYIAHLAK